MIRLGHRLARASAIWLLSAITAVGMVLLTVPCIRAVAAPGRHITFDQLLVAGCAVAATTSALALLAVTSDVLLGLARGRVPTSAGGVRRLVLAACGVAVVATALPTAAQAAPEVPRAPHSVAGLPLPDRAGGGVLRTHPSEPAVAHRVVRGDSLWTIAGRRLGPGSSRADLAAYSRRIYELNASAIGPDPDLLRPGQVLHLPPTEDR